MTAADERRWLAVDVCLGSNVVGLVLGLIENGRLGRDDGDAILKRLFELWSDLDRFTSRVRLLAEVVDSSRN